MTVAPVVRVEEWGEKSRNSAAEGFNICAT